MKTVYTIEPPVADEKFEGSADIVFCVDCTGSMDPCIESVKREIGGFASGLQSAGKIDFRLRLIGFRDLHDPKAKDDPPWIVTGFTRSLHEFQSALGKIDAEGGGPYRGAESALDALYLALRSDWRDSGTHKTIVLLTDDNTHPTLHSTTYKRPDNDIHRVIQEFQTLRHAMLYIVAPRYPSYEQLQKAMCDAERKIVATFVPSPDEDKEYLGLKSVKWGPLLRMLGETLSTESVNVPRLSRARPA